MYSLTSMLGILLPKSSILQSIAERVQYQEAIEESALTPVPNSEEINNDTIFERMQKIKREVSADSLDLLYAPFGPFHKSMQKGLLWFL